MTIQQMTREELEIIELMTAAAKIGPIADELAAKIEGMTKAGALIDTAANRLWKLEELAKQLSATAEAFTVPLDTFQNGVNVITANGDLMRGDVTSLRAAVNTVAAINEEQRQPWWLLAIFGVVVFLGGVGADRVYTHFKPMPGPVPMMTAQGCRDSGGTPADTRYYDEATKQWAKLLPRCFFQLAPEGMAGEPTSVGD